jgi:hypothetical protein
MTAMASTTNAAPAESQAPVDDGQGNAAMAASQQPMETGNPTDSPAPNALMADGANPQQDPDGGDTFLRSAGAARFTAPTEAQNPVPAGGPEMPFAMQTPGEIPLREIAPGEYAVRFQQPERMPGETAEMRMLGRERVILSDREPMRGFGDRGRTMGLKGEGAVKTEQGPGMEGVMGEGGPIGESGVPGEGVLAEGGVFDEAMLAARGEVKEKGKKKKSDKDELFEKHVLRNMEQKEDELSAEEMAKMQVNAAIQQPTFQLRPQEVQSVERPRPVYDAQAIRGIVQEVRMVASPGDKTRIEIQLTSKTLDGLNIKIDRNDEGRLAIQFNTLNNDVAQLLERNMMNLQQSLAANGLRVANLQIVNPTVSTQPMFQQTFTQPSASRESYSGDREGGGQRGGGDSGQGQGGGEQGGGGGSGQQGRRGRR